MKFKSNEVERNNLNSVLYFISNDIFKLVPAVALFILNVQNDDSNES